MARKKRKESETRIYNVSIKGANSQLMFYDDDDRAKFLQALDAACEKYKVRVAARVLMDNHVHLVIHAELDNMARLFKSVGASYVYYFNQKYARTGPLWNARYYSDPVESSEAYKQVTAYIFNNPVVAGMADTPYEYGWSNFCALRNGDDPCGRATMADAGDPDEILQYALNYSAERKFADSDLDLMGSCMGGVKDGEVAKFVKHFIGDISFASLVNLGEKAQFELLKELLSLGSSISQISRVTGISIGRISALIK